MIGRRGLIGRAFALGLLVVASATGCGARRRPALPWRAWPAAQAAAAEEATAGRYDSADSVLLAFVERHPNSPDTLDALFWRAAYLADPANSAPAAATTALELLDRYLAAQVPQPRRYEAGLLRRLAELRAAPPPVPRDTVRAVDTVAVRAAVAREVELREKLHAEEMSRLRDSLARTTAELERIRRRLAPQRPQRP